MTESNSTLQSVLAGFQNGTIVDLTVTLSESLPGSWPGHMPYQRKLFNYFRDNPDNTPPLQGSRGPYHTALIMMDEHCGTHIDAPAHFIPPPNSGLPNAAEIGKTTAEQLELKKMIGPAAVIDLTELTGQGGPGISPEILPSNIEAWEGKHGRLQPGDIVLFRTDWDKFYQAGPEGSKYVLDPFLMKTAPGWPTPGIPALQLLLDRGIVTIGLDGVSVGSSHDGVPPHVFGLGRGMMYVELLANLKSLPPRGALFVFLPLKIEGGSAGPGRAIGLVP